MPFQAPIGTDEERKSGKMWPGTWVDATPYSTKYSLGYHTGADLNNNLPKFDADAHSPIYAIGDGVVTYGQLVSKDVWGNLIVIYHGIVDDKPVYSRYAHVEELAVSKGMVVKMGQQIARVGNQFGKFAYHLHFDISTTEQLKTYPTYWPGNDRKGVLHHFVDPRLWLYEHLNATATEVPTGTGETTNPSPLNPPKPPARDVWYVIVPQVDVYKKPASEKAGTLTQGTELSIDTNKGAQADNKIWAPITDGPQKGNWIAIRKTDQSESYLSTNKPSASSAQPAPAKPSIVWYVIAPKIDIYKTPNVPSEKAGTLTQGAEISIDLGSGKVIDGKLWGQITDGDQKGNWVPIRKQDQSESYLSTNKPQ